MRPKVLGEFRALTMLHEKGVPAVLPIACGWSGSQGILLTRALNDNFTIGDLWPQVREDEKRRVRLLKGITILLKSMLQAKIFHPDLHFGNILAVEKEDGTRCVLVDVHGVKAKRILLLAHKMIMLRMLAGLVHYINLSEIEELLQPLFPEADSKSLENIWRDIIHAAARQIRHKWPGRRRKLLNYNGKSNSICSIAKKEDGTWRWRVGFDLSVARVIIKQHQNKSNMKTIGDNVTKIFSEVTVGGQKYFVKEFTGKSLYRKSSADYCSWLNNWRLENMGFPVPKCLVWFQSEKGSSYLVTEIVEGISLYKELKKAAGNESRIDILLGSLFKLFSDLYRWKIFHKMIDTKNIIVSDERSKPKFYLTDNDSIEFDKKINNWHWHYNCSRLRQALPEAEVLKQRFDQIHARAQEFWLKGIYLKVKL